MALINFLEIYNADRHLIINNKYKNLRLLKVDKLPSPAGVSGDGSNWRYWEYEIDFNMNYIPAIYCANSQYYVTAEVNGGKMTIQAHAPASVSMTAEKVHDAVTLYIFTEEADSDTSGAGLFIWDPETRKLVFNSKTPYLRVVGSHINQRYQQMTQQDWRLLCRKQIFRVRKLRRLCSLCTNFKKAPRRL